MLKRYEVTVTASYVLKLDVASEDKARYWAIEQAKDLSPEWEITECKESD